MSTFYFLRLRKFYGNKLCAIATFLDHGLTNFVLTFENDSEKICLKNPINHNLFGFKENYLKFGEKIWTKKMYLN
jgi:hypothetical protein